MVAYRIRYRDTVGRSESEAVVEANSPNEALVKFRHVRSDRDRPGCSRQLVTSVSVDDHFAKPY